MPQLMLARAAAEHLVEQLGPACERIEIAGSIRRGKDPVKDIELVAIAATATEPTPGDLFGAPRECNRLERLLADVSAGRHCSIVRPKQHAGRTAPWGPRYKKLWVTFESRVQSRESRAEATFPVDLFIATRETFAPLMVIRTGPADFSHRLVTPVDQGGAMPAGLRQHAGRLERLQWAGKINGGQEKVWLPVETPDEESYFAALGLPCWRPAERCESRLVKWLHEHNASAAAVRQRPPASRKSSPYSPYRKEARWPSSSR